MCGTPEEFKNEEIAGNFRLTLPEKNADVLWQSAIRRCRRPVTRGNAAAITPHPMKTILMIEDDPVIARVYKIQFEKAGFRFEVANTAETGLLAFSAERPDLILLDLMLPTISGVEILRRLRANQAYASLPVFVLTAVNYSDLAKQAVDAGANRIFNKAKAIPLDIIDAIEEDGIFDTAAATQAS